MADVAQFPAPSHFAAGVSVVVGLPFEQVAALHCVPEGHFAHCPDTHCPVVPQPDWSCRAHIPCGSELAVMPTQVPRLPAMLQAWQALLQAVPQQTPWAHCPLPHWLLFEQGWPLGFVPQEPATPFIPQVLGATHCASLLQAA